MAVGKYTLPICDGCKLPWLPVGWTQDSDPRQLPEGANPLRCGKCKSIGWDREYVKMMKQETTIQIVVGHLSNPEEDLIEEIVVPVSPTLRAKRCKHRIANCPVCHPKEAA